MSDEELLQIIDFRHRRDYSLQIMNEKITAGETVFLEEQICQEDDFAAAARETVISYTRELEIRMLAAGQEVLFLMGKMQFTAWQPAAVIRNCFSMISIRIL